MRVTARHYRNMRPGRACGRKMWLVLAVVTFPVLSVGHAFALDCRHWGTSSFFSEATFYDVEGCLKLGFDPNFRDRNAETPLFHVLRQPDQTRRVRILLKFGADPNALSRSGIRVMHIAAYLSRDPEIIHDLVRAGGMVNKPIGGNFFPIYFAASSNPHLGTMKAFLENGANPFVVSDAGWSPLTSAILFNDNPDISWVLLDKHLEYHAPSDEADMSPRKRPGLHRARCWFGGPPETAGMECFYMIRRENPDRDTSHLIAIPVIRFFDPDRKNGKNPVLIPGGGGPGNPVGMEYSYFGLHWYYTNLAAAAGRDLYVFDPRGVGMAHPRLHCSDFLEKYGKVFEGAGDAKGERHSFREKYKECKQYLDQLGHDLSQYNSLAVATDAEILRRELDVDKWALFGQSFAARYALTIAREYPGSVEAMVLASPTFPGRGLLEHPVAVEQIPFEKLFAYCEAAPKCDREGLEERFGMLVSRLESEPIWLNITDHRMRDGYGRRYRLGRFVLTGSRLVDLIQQGLGKGEKFERFEILVGELERSMTKELRSWLPGYLEIWLGSTSSGPVFDAHYCSEIYPLVDFAANAQKREKAPEYIRLLNRGITREGEEADCAVWGLPPADPVEERSVETAIPTLFLQGRLDPVTPLEVMQGELKNFRRHEVLVFDGLSHADWHGHECALGAGAHFFEHKKLDSRQRRCADGS